MPNEKVMIIHLTVGLIKKIFLYKVSHFPEQYSRIKSKITVELDLSNYATKSDLKSAAGVYTSDFSKKTDLASLKSDIDQLDVGKLETTQFYLSKLSDTVKNKVVKKTVYDELVKNVDAIETTDTSNLVKKADYDIKIDEIEKKIPNHEIYITTQEFNKLTTNNFAARLTQAFSKCLASIKDNSVITCDEIVEATKISSTKTVPTRSTSTKIISTNFYILLAFLLITIALLIVVIIYCYRIKHQSKEFITMSRHT